MIDLSALATRFETLAVTLSKGQIYMMLCIGLALIVLSLVAIIFQGQRGVHRDPATFDVSGKHKKSRSARNGQILARFDQISTSKA
ncbi:hypothetical protein [Celeribacter marinus]|uniref:hypothetical protein n=1 Tax=Celeribacter marinus TaxID=1397108 RepID=UPI003F6C9EE1